MKGKGFLRMAYPCDDLTTDDTSLIDLSDKLCEFASALRLRGCNTATMQ